MYDLLPIESYPRTIYITKGESFENVLCKLKEGQFNYPFCVKPDVGMKGLLFRKVDKEEQLKYYHENVPLDYLVQELVDYPVEASVFYYRFPNEKKRCDHRLYSKRADGGKRRWTKFFASIDHAASKRKIPRSGDAH